MNPNALIPDWEIPEFLGLVWPENLQGKETKALAKKFYPDLIRILLEEIPEQVSLAIIHRSGKGEHISKDFGTEQIKLIEDDKIQDIWIRDFAPFWKHSENGNVPVKGFYFPDYMNEDYLQASENDEAAGIKLGGEKTEIISIGDDEILMDGGNLTHNGSGFGIITNRLVSDNDYYFYTRVLKVVKSYLGLQKVVLVPVEYGDVTGHVDGMVRFISENEAIVSEYPYKWEEVKIFIDKEDYLFEREQLNEIATHLQTHNLKVFRIPNGVPQISEFGSAVGNYTNFLRVGEKVFVPQYGNAEQDAAALEAFEAAGFSKAHIIPVPDCVELAELGGVLNCITTHIY